MDTMEFMTHAYRTLRQHNLYPYWRFRFDGAKRRFGLCDGDTKTIFMSRYMVSLNTPDECHKTLLHEIAHAIAGCADGHGPRWQAECKRLGIVPARCYNDPSRNVVTTKPNFYEVCPHCKKEYPRFRKTKSVNACGQCCNQYASGKFDARFTLVYSLTGKLDA